MERQTLNERASELKRLLASCYSDAALQSFDAALDAYYSGGSNWGQFWDLAEALDELENMEPDFLYLRIACDRVYCAAEA